MDPRGVLILMCDKIFNKIQSESWVGIKTIV